MDTPVFKNKFKYQHGALTCDFEINGVTQKIYGESIEFYGNEYFICETITQSAAQHFAELLGGKLEVVAA